jgi:hypothetical protein
LTKNLKKEVKKVGKLAKAKDEEEKTLHIYRHDAWNEANLNATSKDEYEADTPQAFVVEPLDIGGKTFFIATDPTLHFYRHEAWNEANHNATHVRDYQSGTTADGQEYAAGYLVPPIELEVPATTPGGASGFLGVRSAKSASLKTYPSIDSHSRIIYNKPGHGVYTVRQHDVSNATRYIENMPKDVYNEPLTTVEELKAALGSSNSSDNSSGNATDDGASAGGAATGDAAA